MALRSAASLISGGSSPAPKTLMESLLYGKPYYHMWFIYMIAGMYLLVPALRKFIGSHSRNQVILATSAAFVPVIILGVYRGLHGEKDVIAPALPLEYIPYFMSGHIIRTSEAKRYLHPMLGAALVIVAVTAGFSLEAAISSGRSSGNYFYSYISVNVMAMSLTVMYLFKLWSRPILSKSSTGKLARLTLGVYLIHPAVIRVMDMLHFPADRVSPFLSIPILSLLVLMISVFCSVVLSKIPFLRKTI